MREGEREGASRRVRGAGAHLPARLARRRHSLRDRPIRKSPREIAQRPHQLQPIVLLGVRRGILQLEAIRRTHSPRAAGGDADETDHGAFTILLQNVFYFKTWSF